MMATKRHEKTRKVKDKHRTVSVRSCFLFVIFRAFLWPFLFFLLTSPLAAAEPAVRNVNVRGLQLGGTTTVTIDGDDLGKSPRLLLPFPAKQTLKPGSTDKQAMF